MELSFDVTWIDMTDEARAFVEENAASVVEAGAILTRDAIVREMDPGPVRAGKEYKIPGTDKKYRASADKQAPAVREGVYRDSWQFTPAVPVKDGVVAFAYTDRTVNGYVLGSLLEYGTVYMEPRPHVRPGMEKAIIELRKLVREASR